MVKIARLLLVALLASSVVLSSSLAEKEEECKNLREKSPSMRLQEYIKCNFYGKTAKVWDSANNTSVAMYIRPEVMNFNEFDGTLDFHGFIALIWFVDHVRWDPLSYAEITTMVTHKGAVWMPDIAVLSADYDIPKERVLPRDGYCALSYNGKMVCVGRIHRKIRCNTDFKLWPYDRQKCHIIVTTWAYNSEQMNLTLHDDTVIIFQLFMYTFRTNGEWNYTMSRVIYGYRPSHYYKNLTSPTIFIEFVMDRMQSHLKGRYVAPAIMMMILTLTAVWMDPKSIERFAVALLNVMLHLKCIQDIHWALPHNGTTAPDILLFYVYSLKLATMVLLLTFLLRKLQDAKFDIPNWISSTTSVILSSKAGQFMLLGMLDPKATAIVEADADDVDDLVEGKKTTKSWTYVTIICSWISVLVVFFAYVLMYALLIPSSAAKPVIYAKEDDLVAEQFGRPI